MTNIITDGKLEGHKVTIKGPSFNESFYVYGEFSLDAVKAALGGNGGNGATAEPAKPRRGRKPKSLWPATGPAGVEADAGGSRDKF